MRRSLRWTLGLAGLALAAAAPFLFGDYRLHLLILAGIFAIVALSLNLVVGYLGQLPLGHMAFYAMGAYTTALLTLKLKVPVYLGILVAVAAGAIFAWLISLIVLRMRESYFVIVTLSFATIFQLLIVNAVDLTNGPMGLVGIPFLKIGSLAFKTKAGYYWLVLGALLVTLFLLNRLVRSRLGRAFQAIRENEPLAMSVGVNPTRFARLAFVLAGGLAALGGALYAHYVRVVTPEAGGFANMVTALVIVVIGGRGTLAGPVLGALVVTFLPEELRMAKEWRLPIFGIILMLVTVLIPGGLISLFNGEGGVAPWLSSKFGRLRKSLAGSQP